MPGQPWAPDGTFFVVTGLRDRQRALYVSDVAGKVRGPVDLGKQSAAVMSITKRRILVRLGASYEKAKQSWGNEVNQRWLAAGATISVFIGGAERGGASHPRGAA